MKRLFGVVCISLIVASATAFAQGKISGLMFGDYFFNVARDSIFSKTTPPNSASSGQKSFQAFQFRRIYVWYDNDISEDFAARFRFEGDQVAATNNGKFSVFVKDAYLRWKNVFAGSDFLFGIQPTSAYEISEGAWGYRSLEKTIMDLRGTVPSRILGVSLKGKVDGAGVLNYWLTVGNNNSGNNAGSPADQFHSYEVQFQVKPSKNLQFTLFGEYRDRPAINDPTSTSNSKATISSAITTYAAFVGYSDASFNIGAEGFMQKTANALVDGTGPGLKSRSAIGVSAFGSVNFRPDLALVLRYDLLDPNTDDVTGQGDKRNYVIAGLSFKPDKNVSIIPNVLYETYESVPTSAGNQKIDPSVTARVTFYYVFL